MTMPVSNPSPNRVIVLVNPRAGRPKARAIPNELAARLAERGFRADIVPNLDHACGEANRLHAAGELRAIVAAGGDGTIAEVVNRTDPGVPITTLPLGTENLLARHFGIRRDANAIAEAVAGQRFIDLDVGRVTNSAGSRLFLLMASAGLDAEIIRRLHDARRGNISHWSYIKPILSAAATYAYAPIRIAPRDQHNAAAQVTESIARWALAFNLPCYAGMLAFLPEYQGQWPYRGSDGDLDICRFDHGGFWHTLYYYVWLLAGRAARIGSRRLEQRPSFRLEPANPDDRVPLQVDGDPCGYLPADIDVLPKRLRLILPNDPKDATTHRRNDNQ